LSQPAGERRDGGRRPRNDDFDSPVGKVLDPAVEMQTLGLLGRGGTVVDALHPARDDAAYRPTVRHASVVGVAARACRTQRERCTILGADGIHARRSVGLLLDLPFGFLEESPRIGERVRCDATCIGLLGGIDRLTRVAHFLDRRRGHATRQRKRAQGQ